ncbi:MAG: hypothetical protein KGL39_54710 [Patescibacteria group bacterium]|nr:hypothetical protein [Patescibacteria group bacterium]
MSDPILEKIEAFLVSAEMSPTAFGRDAMADPGFVFALRAGRDCRRSTLEMALSQIENFKTSGDFRKPAEMRSKDAA